MSILCCASHQSMADSADLCLAFQEWHSQLLSVNWHVSCRLSGVWRTAFGLGIIPLCFIIFWRVYKLQESAVWVASRVDSNRKRETLLLFRYFWPRC